MAAVEPFPEDMLDVTRCRIPGCYLLRPASVRLPPLDLRMRQQQLQRVEVLGEYQVVFRPMDGTVASSAEVGTSVQLLGRPAHHDINKLAYHKLAYHKLAYKIDSPSLLPNQQSFNPRPRRKRISASAAPSYVQFGTVPPKLIVEVKLRLDVLTCPYLAADRGWTVG